MPMGWIYRKCYGAPAMGFASNRKRQKVGFRKAGHDEPRDGRGRWTTGGATARTQRWRTAVRGVDRLAQEIHEAATAQLEGRPLDEYQRQLMQTPIQHAGSFGKPRNGWPSRRSV